MTSFIYVIGADKAGPVKIGLSVNPDKRLRQLQTGHPARLSLFHTMEVDATKVALMEKIIHKTVRPWKGVGEWFHLSADDAIAEVEFALIRYGDANIRNYL